MKKILICGDSFSADWTKKYQGKGWPNMLAEDHQITNLSQAGCSEYKIYLQLISIDINLFDTVIVSHTSPYRMYVKEHPVHFNDPLHKNADLIYTDIKAHAENNKELSCIVEFYEKYFDIEYAIFTHNLLCEQIEKLFKYYKGKIIHITNMPRDNLYIFKDMIFFTNLLKKKYKGLMNHYNDEANNIVYHKISSLLEDHTIKEEK